MTTAQFNSLPVAKQRLLIVKDALKRLATGQYIPTPGEWCKVTSFEDPSLQRHVKAGRECRVCQLGGIIASYAGYANELEITEQFYGGYATHFEEAQDRLDRIFGDKALREIEYVFERGQNWARGLTDTSEDRRAKLDSFYSRYKTNKGLFKAIFTNMVKNKGEFIP